MAIVQDEAGRWIDSVTGKEVSNPNLNIGISPPSGYNQPTYSDFISQYNTSWSQYLKDRNKYLASGEGNRATSLSALQSTLGNIGSSNLASLIGQNKISTPNTSQSWARSNYNPFKRFKSSQAGY